MTDRKSEEQDNQGEGNREAAREYNADTRAHVRSGKVDEAARKAGDQDPEEAARSEEKGRARATEEDPEVERDYSTPTKP
jgi:hypothetical protein